MNKLKSRNRKVRRTITIISVLVIILIIFTLSTTSMSSTEINYIDYTICKNDTLWSIASIVKENNINYNNTDIRKIIYEIKQLNNMNVSNIYEGQKIIIPEI